MGKGDNGWTVEKYAAASPFFITMSNGSIDKNSLKGRFWSSTDEVVCLQNELMEVEQLGSVHTCVAPSNGNFMNFSEKNLSGAYASTFGALQSSDLEARKVAVIAIERFTCQLVR